MQLRTGMIDRRISLNKDVYEFDVLLEEPVDFQAGQFITFRIPHNGAFVPRSYSIASGSSHKDALTICIKIVPNGIGSNYLFEIPIGEKIDFLGPVGHFTFQSQDAKNVVFVATGTGIAPFMSMIEQYVSQYSHIQFHIIFGVRYIEDLFYQDILSVYSRNYRNFHYHFCISRPSQVCPFFHGRVTQYLKTQTFEDADFYICGNGSMVQEVESLLQSQNVTPQRIYSEKYNNI